MIILIAGVPGSGKSTLAKEISKVTGCKVLSVTDIVVKNKMYSEVDKDECGKPLYVVDMDKLESYVNSLKGCYIIEGVVVDFVPPEKVKKVIYVQAKPEVLIRRMEEKGYCKEKICSNLEAELVGAYLQMLVGLYGERVSCVRGDKPLEESLKEAMKILKCDRRPCSPWDEEDFRSFSKYCL